MEFYVGLHQPHVAWRFERACISVNRLRGRKGPFKAQRWIMDSGAFTEVSTHGHYRHDVATYAAEIGRWIAMGCGILEAVVAQDFMCEPWIVRKTGLSIAEHQRLTIERFDALVRELADENGNLPVHVMPVLQGYDPADYARHVRAYGERLTPGMWVGVGSVCKRNGRPEDVVAVLDAIACVRPDLHLHGFGLKKTALMASGVRALIGTADSMAWSFAARREGRNANCWTEAATFVRDIEQVTALAVAPWQPSFQFEIAS